MSKDLYALALTGQQSASIEGYLQSVSTIPMLGAEEEKRLATRLQEEGDLNAAKATHYVALEIRRSHREKLLWLWFATS